MIEGDQNLEKIKADELRREKLGYINQILKPYKLKINIEFVDVSLSYARLTEKEWRDMVDYLENGDIEDVDPKYKDAEDYFDTLSDRLVDAITTHDLQEV